MLTAPKLGLAAEFHGLNVRRLFLDETLFYSFR